MAPHGVGAQHSVENREELTHAGGGGNLLRLAGGEEALVKLANHVFVEGLGRDSRLGGLGDHCGVSCRRATSPERRPALGPA